MRSLFIAHEPNIEPGWIGERAAQRGFDVEVLVVTDEMRWPDARAYDLVVPLGSERSAYDDTLPWLPGELAMLRDAAAADVPVFGICFGGQALARALGGAVQPAVRPEVGWLPVDTTAPGLVASGPWLLWHGDALTPPPGATVLARGDVGVQAFRLGRTLGVQFHPEVTPEILAGWIRHDGRMLARAAVDPEALLKETRRRAPKARRAAHDLFDRVLEALTGGPAACT